MNIIINKYYDNGLDGLLNTKILDLKFQNIATFLDLGSNIFSILSLFIFIIPRIVSK